MTEEQKNLPVLQSFRSPDGTQGACKRLIFRRYKKRAISGDTSKGLSALQRWILRQAFKNRDTIHPYGAITNRDILRDYYGFRQEPGTENARNGALVFSVKRIGFRRYRSASVAASRSLNRLEERELGSRKCNFGLVLNQRGARIARMSMSRRRSA